ncbi:MAG: hypothetical protein U1F45_18785 [Burkholderiales bacterium]
MILLAAAVALALPATVVCAFGTLAVLSMSIDLFSTILAICGALGLVALWWLIVNGRNVAYHAIPKTVWIGLLIGVVASILIIVGAGTRSDEIVFALMPVLAAALALLQPALRPAHA